MLFSAAILAPCSSSRRVTSTDPFSRKRIIRVVTPERRMKQWGRPPHSPWRLYPHRDPIRAKGYWSDHGIRKSWILYTPVSRVGLIDEHVDTTYGYDYLGQDAKALADFIAGKGEFAKKFAAAKTPLDYCGKCDRRTYRWTCSL